MLVNENGRKRNLSLREVTPENFIVPNGEEHLYHCRIEVERHSPDTGDYISVPRMQVFGKKFFETSGLHNLRKQGYKVDVLHDPNRWIEANRARAEEERKACEAAEAKAEEERKAAEREALKKEMRSEIIAELKRDGLINVESPNTTAESKKTVSTKKE